MLCSLGAYGASALLPGTSTARYSKTTWAQKDGLPQDAIKRIVQSVDGYLWLATDEGLARFDGYEFTVFNKDNGDLPSNSVTALAAGPDGSLWIGTANGLVRYRGNVFHTYSAADGISAVTINDLYVDRHGTLWIIAGGMLSRFDGQKIALFSTGKDLPFTIWTALEDRRGTLWVAGFSGLARWNGSKFVTVIDSAAMGGNLITTLVTDNNDNLWMGGPRGVIQLAANGGVHKFDTSQGLPHAFVRSLIVDREGTLWAGTNSGFARLAGKRFVTLAASEREKDQVWCLYEDHEGDLWEANRQCPEPIPTRCIRVLRRGGRTAAGDDPVSVYQDRRGRLWVGFHNNGLMMFSPDGTQRFTTRNGLPSDEVFSIREARDGSLLLATRGGLAWMRGNQFSAFRPTDELHRNQVLDVWEDTAGKLWLALPSGLAELKDKKIRLVIPARETLLNGWTVSLLKTGDGSLSGRGPMRMVYGESGGTPRFCLPLPRDFRLTKSARYMKTATARSGSRRSAEG